MIESTLDEILQGDRLDNKVIVPDIIEEELQEDDFSGENEINVSDTEDSSETSMKRGPGRTKLIKMGSRGRSKKSYNMLANKNQEADMFAEVSLREERLFLVLRWMNGMWQWQQNYGRFYRMTYGS